MKRIFLTVLIISFAIKIILLLTILFEKNLMWEGEIESVSADNKYVLTITSEYNNSFDAPYSVRISNVGDNVNLAYDFYIYECSEVPIINWRENYVFISCLNHTGEEVVYKIEVEDRYEE